MVKIYVGTTITYLDASENSGPNYITVPVGTDLQSISVYGYARAASEEGCTFDSCFTAEAEVDVNSMSIS